MVTAAVAIVCPAVLGATAAAVTQSVATSALVGSAISGIMNGAASVKADMYPESWTHIYELG